MTAAEVLSTARLDVAPGWLRRLELATRIRLPSLTMIRPIGAAPTATRAISGRDGLSRSAVAEKPSSVSLSLLVTQTSLPSGEVITRTGLQPAVAVGTTAVDGLTSARGRLITVIVPWDGPNLRLARRAAATEPAGREDHGGGPPSDPPPSALRSGLSR